MDIRVKATDYSITPEVSNYLDSRIASLQKLLVGSEEVTRIEVELGRDAGRPKHGANIWFAEMHIYVPGEAHVYARNNSESVNGAIDDVKEEVERQLRKERKLHVTAYRKAGAFAKRLLRFGQGG